MPSAEAEWTSPSPGNGPEGTGGLDGQEHPLTLKGGPDKYKFLPGSCSGLSTRLGLLLHRYVQAFVTDEKEKSGTASIAVLRGFGRAKISRSVMHGCHAFLGYTFFSF